MLKPLSAFSPLRYVIVQNYHVLYKLTNIRLIALLSSLVIFTILETLNLWTLFALYQIFNIDFDLDLDAMEKIFRLPYVLLICFTLMLVNFLICLPLGVTLRDKKQPGKMVAVIIYTVITLIMYGLAKYTIQIK
jgi:hypothetical protein